MRVDGRVKHHRRQAASLRTSPLIFLCTASQADLRDARHYSTLLFSCPYSPYYHYCVLSWNNYTINI